MNTAQNEKKNYENPMGFAPLFPLLIKMSVPSIFSMLIMALYNIVDSMYVAKLSETALSAVSLIYPVQLLTVAVSIGTGVGVSSLISRRLGEKDIHSAQNAANHAIVIANIEWILFLVFGIFFSKPFAIAFSDSTELVTQAATYCSITCIGSIFSFNAIAGERIMQSCGNMIFPMYSQIIGSIVNIILDPIMIFGKFGCPAMGVAGAAYATVIGQFFSMIASYLFLIKGKFPVQINIKDFKFNGKTIKDIFSVGLPAMIMQTISAFTTIFLNKILIGFSDTAVAVMGVYYKLQSFIFMPLFGLAQGVMPIMGYNFGAKNRKRLMNSLKLSLFIGVGFMIIGTVLFLTIPDKLLSLFHPSEEMLTLGVSALRTISVCFPFAAMAIIPAQLFQATGHGIVSMFNSVLRQIVALVPAAYILSIKMGVSGVWTAFPFAEIFSLTYTAIMLIRVYNKDIKNLDKAQ